ncbi:MAG: hypothetical protein C4576_19255 [Desulfobacteraceae bacterium]|nr:MAG: hypothetical protein C4576_19255 [Desulfobacteraceae bacterium]
MTISGFTPVNQRGTKSLPFFGIWKDSIYPQTLNPRSSLQISISKSYGMHRALDLSKRFSGLPGLNR